MPMSVSEISTCNNKPVKIEFSEPAKYWTDATPIGNGGLGAMVWGGVSSDIIQLNGDIASSRFQFLNSEFFVYSLYFFRV